MNKDSNQSENPFTSGKAKNQGILREIFGWLKNSKKWWLLPILIALLVVGLLVGLGSSVFAPLIYTLW